MPDACRKIRGNPFRDDRHSLSSVAMLERRRFALFALLATFSLTACREKSTRSEDPPVIRIGMDLSYPPFEMLDRSGSPDGVSVRIAEALANHLGRELKIVPMDFSGLIPALQTGNIDLVLSSMTATEERRGSIDFSDPYAFTGLALLVSTKSDIQSIKDLHRPGRILTAKTATTGQSWITRHLPDAKLVVFEDPSACVMEVAQGRADAFIYDQLSIHHHAQENPDTTRAILAPFVEESWAIGIAKGNDTLRSQVNDFIARFREKKGFELLGDRYLKEEKSFLEKQGVPFILR